MSGRLKVLVADDNPTVLKLVAMSLDKCELITASDGADALMKAIDSKPDLIIADYSMPVMDGRALFDKLRARTETQSIPFVFLASQKEIDERLRTQVDGVEDYFVKPFFVRDLARQAHRITTRILQERMAKESAAGGHVTGRLSEMNLIDWMQSLEQGRKTCTLIVRHRADECRLFFNEGQVTHATCRDLVGDPAVFKVLTWTDGEWELDFASNSRERTTTMNTQALMMEGLRLLDEANRDASS